MENNFNPDSFEEFLQDQLRNHRMFPKDTVWREINTKLHGEKRWPGLTIAAFMLVSATTLICLHFSSRQNIFSIKPVLEPISPAHAIVQQKDNAQAKLNTIQFRNGYNTQDELLVAKSNIGVIDYAPNNIDAQTDALPGTEAITENIAGNDDRSTEQKQVADLLQNEKKTIIAEDHPADELTNAKVNAKSVRPSVETAKPIFSSPGLSLNGDTHTAKTLEKNAFNNNSVEEKTPSTIDNFKAENKPGKFSILLYLAPSISYRRLMEDHTLLKGSNNGPVGVNQVADVNDVVRHKPSKGLEGGISLLYDFTKKIRLKSGFQFNVRQYTIDAYRSNTEVSSIALVENNRIDTINTLVYYRNYNGNSSTELLNRYYQLSVPLGLEWEVVGNKRFQFNIAGSIQPTLILNRSAYLLTTNFKNYTENNDLVRKWNINSNFEAFVTMVVGDVKWQLGPQIRYQPYSTFVKQYPIHEHLIDYGIKLGVSTRIK